MDLTQLANLGEFIGGVAVGDRSFLLFAGSRRDLPNNLQPRNPG